MPSLAEEFAKDAGVPDAGKKPSVSAQFSADLVPQPAAPADDGTFRFARG